MNNDQETFESEKALAADVIIDEQARLEVKREQEAQCVEWISAELERMKIEWGDPEQFKLALNYVALSVVQSVQGSDVEAIAEVASAFHNTTVQ